MKISRIDIYKLNIELTRPTVVPIGVLDAARNILVRISTDSGLQGWGEASPFAPITGDTDEPVFDDKDALKLVNMGAVDYLNIKLGKSGGIRTALPIEAIAQAAGLKCMIGGGIELPDEPGLGASIADEYLKDCEHVSVQA